MSTYCNIEKVVELLVEQKIIKSGQSLEDVSFYKPKVSNECPSGYKGRIGIYEILPVNETIKQLIVENATSDKIQQQPQHEGMLTIVEDRFIKAAHGLTSIEEVLRVIIE